MTRLNSIVFAALSMSSLVVALSLGAEERIRPGNYEVTSTRAGKTSTTTYCLAEDVAMAANADAGTLKADLKKSAAARKCTVSDVKVDGNTVSFSMVCVGVSVASRTTYHGDSYETVNTTTTVKGSTTSETKARRLGDCP